MKEFIALLCMIPIAVVCAYFQVEFIATETPMIVSLCLGMIYYFIAYTMVSIWWK